MHGPRCPAVSALEYSVFPFPVAPNQSPVYVSRIEFFKPEPPKDGESAADYERLKPSGL
jgi:hypothetical protein